MNLTPEEIKALNEAKKKLVKDKSIVNK